MITKNTKLVIFDVDGTLLDSEKPYVECCMTILKKWGYDNITREPFYKCMGLSRNVYEKQILSYLGDDFPLKEFRQAVREYEPQYYLEHPRKLMPGTLDTLKFLKDNKILIAIATSRYRDKSDRNLDSVGLTDAFDYSICGDEISKSKPDPEIFLKVTSHFNIDPSEAIVVEDSSNGLNAATNGGFRCILIPDVAYLSDEDKAKAYKVLDRLDKVIDVICEENRICRK